MKKRKLKEETQAETENLSYESEGKNREGEIITFMEDIKKDSNEMMKELIHIDDLLCKIKAKVGEEPVNKQEINRLIDSVRLRIGILEREERIELNEEEEAETLLEKLKGWVDRVV